MQYKRVLYIEDDIDNQTLIGLFLKNEPFELFTADSPGKALDILKKESIDIIIADLNLQIEGDGVSLIRQIRTLPEYKTTTVFVFSGFDISHFSRYGIDDLIQKYFRKPVRKKILVDALREAAGIEVSQM